VFLLGFVNTAVFFFQVVLGGERGWSKEWVAGSLAAFAASSALSMFVSGSLVDRFTARRLFPYYFAPYVIGLVLVAFIQAPWVYPLGLLFMGLSNGMGSTIKSALQAELFGTRYLGTVRSLFTVLMVVSTALGPVTFGALLDREVGFLAILLGCATAVVGAILQSFRVKHITSFNF
jgi:MFS family permease